MAKHEPDVRFHIEKYATWFLCDDKHASKTWWGKFDDAFLCRFDTVEDAQRAGQVWGGTIRVSVDGELA